MSERRTENNKLTTDLVKRIQRAKRLNPSLTGADLVERFGCGRATIYKALNLEEVTANIPMPDRRGKPR